MKENQERNWKQLWLDKEEGEYWKTITNIRSYGSNKDYVDYVTSKCSKYLCNKCKSIVVERSTFSSSKPEELPGYQIVCLNKPHEIYAHVIIDFFSESQGDIKKYNDLIGNLTDIESEVYSSIKAKMARDVERCKRGDEMWIPIIERIYNNSDLLQTPLITAMICKATKEVVEKILKKYKTMNDIEAWGGSCEDKVPKPFLGPESPSGGR